MGILAKSNTSSASGVPNFRGYDVYIVSHHPNPPYVGSVRCQSWVHCYRYLEQFTNWIYGRHFTRPDSEDQQDEMDNGEQAYDTKSPPNNSISVSQQEIILIVVLICIILAFVVLLVTIKLKFSALVKAQMAQRRILRSRATNLSANRRTENQYIVPGTVGLYGRHSLLEGREETHAIININPNRLTATRQSLSANRSGHTANHVVPPVLNNNNQPEQNDGSGNTYVQIGMSNTDSA